jgi:hypothetical protein
VWNKEAIQVAFHGTRRHSSTAECAQQGAHVLVAHKTHNSCDKAGFPHEPFWFYMTPSIHPALVSQNWWAASPVKYTWRDGSVNLA